MAEPCVVCGVPVGPTEHQAHQGLRVCVQCGGAAFVEWFAWRGVPFLRDGDIDLDTDLVAMVEVDTPQGGRARYDVYAHGQLKIREGARAVFVRDDLYEALRDTLADLGDRVGWG